MPDVKQSRLEIPASSGEVGVTQLHCQILVGRVVFYQKRWSIYFSDTKEALLKGWVARYKVCFDPAISDSIFQQQKKRCPRRSLTRRPVSVWLPMKTQKTGGERQKKNSLTIPFHPKMCCYCSALSCIWWFSITRHVFAICTFILEFRGELRSLEDWSLDCDLHSHCLVIERPWRGKGPSVCPDLATSLTWPTQPVLLWFQRDVVTEWL